MNVPKILDVTLRDGSYEVNFSFTSADTKLFCEKLQDAGIRYIEVGHGVGLGASEKGYGKAMENDAEYLSAASQAMKTASYGMFCIPGIAELSDVDLAAQHGMHFIRIGTNVTEVKASEAFIKKAKEYGMLVAANYMKSYALSPEEFAQQVLRSESYGTDIVYIVDSAGGMFPDDIERYYNAIRKVSNIRLGFHGHDNLNMAVANSLKAVELGVEFIDASLQGLGRSAGNTCMETLVAALLKLGYNLELDLLQLIDLGHTHVQPLLTAKGRMPLDVIAGYADFHSSYMPHIHKCAAKHQIDPRVLIVELCKIDKVNLDPRVLEDIALRIRRTEVTLGNYAFNRYVGGEQDTK